MAIKFSEVKELSQTELLAKASDFLQRVVQSEIAEGQQSAGKTLTIERPQTWDRSIETQLTALRHQAINQ